LRDNGVTCLRLMLEYAQVRHRYFKKPAGRLVPATVRRFVRAVRDSGPAHFHHPARDFLN
jgi:hypothetical protein